MQLHRQIVSYGVSLARRLSGRDVEQVLANIDDRRTVGVVHVAVVRSHIPDAINIECWLDGDELKPGLAVAAIQVADQRLRFLHDIGPGPLRILSIEEVDALTLRETAERIVDMCRQSRLQPSVRAAFDRSREECVKAVMIELAVAPVTPGALASAG